jgi:hypothetical protein
MAIKNKRLRENNGLVLKKLSMETPFQNVFPKKEYERDESKVTEMLNNRISNLESELEKAKTNNYKMVGSMVIMMILVIVTIIKVNIKKAFSASLNDENL